MVPVAKTTPIQSSGPSLPQTWIASAHLLSTTVVLGWLKETALPSFTFVVVLIGLGHSVLALSGEETLAQVNREIAAPKHKNLQRTGFIVFKYGLLFISLVSFFAVMIIPDAVSGEVPRQPHRWLVHVFSWIPLPYV